MQRFLRFKTFVTPIIEMSVISIAFITAYNLRNITDGIPFIQLRIPYIAFEQFIPFVIFWAILWGVIFSFSWLYTLREDTPIFEEIRLVIKYSLLWFFVYISIVYLSTGFIFKKEIPRLIIFYVYTLWSASSIFIRYIGHRVYEYLWKYNYIKKKHILVIQDNSSENYAMIEKDSIRYTKIFSTEKWKISDLIRSGTIDAVISLSYNNDSIDLSEIISLTRIYGVPFSYPKFLPHVENFTRREWFIGWLPVIEIRSLSINFWERFLKRLLDIILSIVSIILIIPIYIIIGIGIKIEDPSWPILFKNRRIWQNGKIFDLYKFRYMYWRYSIKDAYGVESNWDEALKYEESLKKKYDTRNGPLYKIHDDPRKMKFWKVIERLSLDELPQLFNVLLGHMSLIWPRPHQPREVNLYDEEDKQVLIIRPWITWMAQVYGREKNTFKEEVALDRYYIEHYSLLLDMLIFMRTFIVIFARIWKREKPLAKNKKNI